MGVGRYPPPSGQGRQVARSRRDRGPRPAGRGSAGWLLRRGRREDNGSERREDGKTVRWYVGKTMREAPMPARRRARSKSPARSRLVRGDPVSRFGKALRPGPARRELDPIEIASRDRLTALQVIRLKWTLHHVYRNAT